MNYCILSLKVNFRFSQSNAGGESWDAAYSIAENIQRSAEREKLQKQIAALENMVFVQTAAAWFAAHSMQTAIPA